MKRILFIVNVDWFFVSHRLPVALGAISDGYEVHLATTFTDKKLEISNHGILVHDIKVVRGKSGILFSAFDFFQIYRIIKQVKPDILHAVTIKPVLFGGIAARILSVPCLVAAVSGLGAVFVHRGIRMRVIRRLVLMLYKLALAHNNHTVIFQNSNDLEVLVSNGAVEMNHSRMIPGSGVNLDDCEVFPEPSGRIVVTMACRLLREKGVYDFVRAAEICHSRGLDIEFRLIGSPDPGNPSSVPQSLVSKWKDEKIVQVLGFRDDVIVQYQKSHVVVLPSYYGEGVPKSLLEAAACGRPIITTDFPGCRDAVIPGKTGLLVPAKDPETFVEAIQILAIDGDLRRQLGRSGRRLAEEKFGIAQVVDAHLKIYRDLLNP